MTRFRGLSIKLKSLVASNKNLSKSSGAILQNNSESTDSLSNNEDHVDSDEEVESSSSNGRVGGARNSKRFSSKRQSRNSVRISMNFEMLDPVLILKKRQQMLSATPRDNSKACGGDLESRQLRDLIQQHIYSHKVMLYILEFVPLDLQRFYLNPSKDRTVTSIMCKYLFGYFESDPTRSVHYIFKSLKISFQGEQLHAISPLRNATSLQLSNYQLLKKTQMDKLEHLYLTANNNSSGEMVSRSPREVTRKWIKRNLKSSKNLKTIECDRNSILSQDTINMLLHDFPQISSVQAHVQFMQTPITPPATSLTDCMESPRVILIESPRVPATESTEDELRMRFRESKLTHLNLTCDILTNEFMKAVLGNTRWRSLKFSAAPNSLKPIKGEGLTAESLSELPNLKELTTLHLHNVAELGEEECNWIAGVTSLRNLSLVNCGLTDSSLIKILTSLPCLESLNISKNSGLTSDALKGLSKSKITNVVALDIPLNKDALYYLSCSRLTSLTLSGQYIGDSELATLFDFSLAKSLKKLVITGVNTVTNTGLRIIKGDTPVLESLTLTLCDNISHRGLQFLSEHPSIVELHLRKSYTCKSITGIESLFTMSSLRTLDLHNIPLTNQELNFLKAQSKPNTSLKTLVIPACELDGSYTELLLNHYKSLRHLEILLPAHSSIEEWSMKNGIFIGQYSDNFEELHIHGVEPGRQTTWQRVLFHTIPTLQRVKAISS